MSDLREQLEALAEAAARSRHWLFNRLTRIDAEEQREMKALRIINRNLVDGFEQLEKNDATIEGLCRLIVAQNVRIFEAVTKPNQGTVFVAIPTAVRPRRD